MTAERCGVEFEISIGTLHADEVLPNGQSVTARRLTHPLRAIVAALSAWRMPASATPLLICTRLSKPRRSRHGPVLITDLVPSELRATALGTYATATGLALLPASLVAGVLWQAVGPWAPFAYGAALGALALLLLMPIPIRRTAA